MTCSPARLAANQQNAAKSTGPKTPEGKAASRRNALKHGLSGTGRVVRPDDQAEINQRIAMWSGEFPPASDREKWLVRELATAQFNSQRGLALEAALVTSHMDRDIVNWDIDRDLAAEKLGQKLAEGPALTVLQLLRTSHGCDWLAQRWTALSDGLDGDTCLWNEADVHLALNLLGTTPAVRHLDRKARELAALATKARAGDSAAIGPLRERIAAEIAALRERAEALWEQFEHKQLTTLEKGLRFDFEKDTQAVRRLTAANQRLFLRTLKELVALHADRPKAPPAPVPAPAPASPPPAAAPPAEASDMRPITFSNGKWVPTPSSGISYVDISIVGKPASPSTPSRK